MATGFGKPSETGWVEDPVGIACKLDLLVQLEIEQREGPFTGSCKFEVHDDFQKPENPSETDVFPIESGFNTPESIFADKSAQPNNLGLRATLLAVIPENPMLLSPFNNSSGVAQAWSAKVFFCLWPSFSFDLWVSLPPPLSLPFSSGQWFTKLQDLGCWLGFGSENGVLIFL